MLNSSWERDGAYPSSCSKSRGANPRAEQHTRGMNIRVERQSGCWPGICRSVRVHKLALRWGRNGNAAPPLSVTPDPECRVGLQLINYTPAPCAFSNTWYISTLSLDFWVWLHSRKKALQSYFVTFLQHVFRLKLRSWRGGCFLSEMMCEVFNYERYKNSQLSQFFHPGA